MFNKLTTPTTPFGRYKVTTTNKAPSAYNQTSGSAEVKYVLAKLTTIAPIIAPYKVPRPPIATQITNSIEMIWDLVETMVLQILKIY